MKGDRPSDLARPCVRALPTYMGPLVSGPSENNPVRLASNENPLGAGVMARRALAEAADLAGRYPDGGCVGLRQDIASRHGVTAEQVVVGNGSNEILELACRVFLEAGTSAVYSAYCFAVYPLIVRMSGAEPLMAPTRGHAQDVDALLDAVRDDTRLLFVANPNNPTASCLSGGEIRRLLERMPEQVVVVLDQAYAEYVTRPDYEDWKALEQLHPALIVTRSFSKIHGLAALRVGYGIASSEIIGLMERVRQPFNVNMAAQLAARAALADSAHLERSRQLNAEGMDWLQRELNQLSNSGLEVLAAAANFITCRTPMAADRLCDELLKRGVLVRSLAPYEMPQHFRVTVGLPEENRTFIAALQEVLPLA